MTARQFPSDLRLHRHAAQDLEWFFEYGKMTPENSLTLLGTMRPTSKFGELFQYSNLMAAAA